MIFSRVYHMLHMYGLKIGVTWESLSRHCLLVATVLQAFMELVLLRLFFFLLPREFMNNGPLLHLSGSFRPCFRSRVLLLSITSLSIYMMVSFQKYKEGRLQWFIPIQHFKIDYLYIWWSWPWGWHLITIRIVHTKFQSFMRPKS